MDEGYVTLETDNMKKILDYNKESVDGTNQNDVAANINNEGLGGDETGKIVTEDIVEGDDSNTHDSSSITSVSTSLPVTDDKKSVQLPDSFMATVNDLSDMSSVSSDSSSSDNEDGEKKKKKKRFKEKVKELNMKLTEANKDIKDFKFRFSEETDAKERLEAQLLKLQGKYQDQLKDEEALRSQLVHKDDYCSNLEQKLSSLEKELVMLRGASASAESIRRSTDDDNLSLQVNEDLDEGIEKLKEKLISSNVLIETYIAQIEHLDRENLSLKNKLSLNGNEENKDLTEIVENKVQEKIKILESENSALQQNLEDFQKKYAESLVTLTEVEDAYGDKADVVIAKYKQEVAILQDRVRIAEESSNESLITGLRQEVLDVQLTLERAKQLHKDGMEIVQKKLEEEHRLLEEQKLDADNNRRLTSDAQNMLNSVQELANERMQKIMELKTEAVALQDSIKVMKQKAVEKGDEMSNVKKQLHESADLLGQEHEAKKALAKELEEMDSVREMNRNLEEEVDELQSQTKMRAMKIKFLKKQAKDLEEQKQKAESVMFMLPEMQKKVEELENDKQKLMKEIESLRQLEEERLRKIEQDRKDEEERLRKEKEQWERIVLGIGKCELYHNGELHDDMDLSASLDSRPSSAPPLKPRPPSSRPLQYGSNQRKLFTKRAPTLNPTYLSSYPEGIRATEKMKHRQERIVLAKKNKKNLYRSLTEPVNFLNSHGHSDQSNKYFPKISKKSKPRPNSAAPRVLVWGESHDGPGKMLVAVGDYVLTKIARDCADHGSTDNEYTGHIKFIGFIEGNEQDVYIGIRLDDEVGNTDGRVGGKRYFRCESRRGKFVHLEDIVKVIDSPTKNHAPTLSL